MTCDTDESGGELLDVNSPGQSQTNSCGSMKRDFTRPPGEQFGREEENIGVVCLASRCESLLST